MESFYIVVNQGDGQFEWETNNVKYDNKGIIFDSGNCHYFVPYNSLVFVRRRDIK